MRLHQSYSAGLLGRGGKTLLELKRDIDRGRKPTKAMEDGALVDQMLYGGHTYCEADTCTYRSGPKKGETFEADDWTSADAQEQRKAARERGQVCALRHEVDAALAQKQSLLEVLLDAGIDLLSKHTRLMGEQLFQDDAQRPDIYTQPKVLWTSPEGVECEGTPDVLIVHPDMHWALVDTKLSVRADADWAEKQTVDMGWHVQAGAYREAGVHGLGLDPEKFDGYAIAICEKRSGMAMSAVHWLEDMFLHCGEEEWKRCKARWGEALKNNEWPGVSGGKISPPGYYVSRLFDSADSAGAEDLSSIGLDTSGLETEE